MKFQITSALIALCTAGPGAKYNNLAELKQSSWWIEPAQTVRIAFSYTDSSCINCKITDVYPGDAIYVYQTKAVNNYDCRIQLQKTDEYINTYLERAGMGFE